MLRIIQKEIVGLKNAIKHIIPRKEEQERIEEPSEEEKINMEMGIVQNRIEEEKVVEEKSLQTIEELNNPQDKSLELKPELHIASIESDKAKTLSKRMQNLNFGDIISAKRYTSLEERERMEPGHRVGPFIVVGSYQDFVLAVYGTSKKPKEFIHLYYFFLDKIKGDRYTLTKDTYFQVSRIYPIRDKQYVSKLGTLSDEEKNLVTKQIKVARDRQRYGYLGNIPFSLPKSKIEFGDIISYQNKIYFIYQENQDSFLGFQLTKGDEASENRIYINRKYYVLNFETEIEIPKSYPQKKIRIADLPSPNQALGILASRKKYFEEKKKKEECSRGTIITNQNEIYYIYGEEGQEWLIFEVFNEEQNSTQRIQINTTEFYTNFSNRMKLTKRKAKDYTIVTKAKDLEMDQIKKQKKEYERSHQHAKEKAKKIQKASIKEGSVVVTNNLAREIYIVLERTNDTVTWISIEDLLNQNRRIETATIGGIHSVAKITNNQLEAIKHWIKFSESNLENALIESISNKQKKLI